MDDLFKKYPRKLVEPDSDVRQRLDAQENVLILFRKWSLYNNVVSGGLTLHQLEGKLREGISSSRRTDAFALEGMAHPLRFYPTAEFTHLQRTKLHYFCLPRSALQEERRRLSLTFCLVCILAPPLRTPTVWQQFWYP